LGIREGGAGPHPEVRTGNRGQEETAGRLKPPKLPPEGVWGVYIHNRQLLEKSSLLQHSFKPKIIVPPF